MNPLHVALDEYAVTEKTGAVHERRVLQYFHDLGHTWVKDDETAWCSAFAGWVCKEAGVSYSDKLNARSWLAVGKETTSPEQGDVVVLWREKKAGWKGHVGFFVTKRDGYIYILGGNQSNMVNISKYPESRLLGYRRVMAPTGATGKPVPQFTISSVPSKELITEFLERLKKNTLWT